MNEFAWSLCRFANGVAPHAGILQIAILLVTYAHARPIELGQTCPAMMIHGHPDTPFGCTCMEGTVCHGKDCLRVSTGTGFNPTSTTNVVDAACVEYAALDRNMKFSSDYHFLAGAKGHAIEHGTSDSDTVNVVIIASDSEHGAQSQATMNSILAVRDSAKIHFYIFVSDAMVHDTNGALHKYKVAINNTCTHVFLHSVSGPLNAATKLQKETNYKNSHYSGIYALLKLVVHDFLPSHLNSYILLDSDMIFIGNIGRMRQLARHGEARRPGAVVAMGCTYDPRRVNEYCTKRNQPKNCHPTDFCISAPFYGNLVKMRAMRWTETVVRAAMEGMHPDYPSATYSTADQDVFNRILAETPDHMSPLPCRWSAAYSTYGTVEQTNLPSVNICYHEKPLVYHFNVGSNTKEKNWHFGLWEEYAKMSPAMVNDPTVCPE